MTFDESFEEKLIRKSAEGAMDSAIKHSSKAIKEFAKKLLNKELSFIEDDETIDIAKEQRKSGEAETFIKEYAESSRHKLLYQMGLTLRKLEKQNKNLNDLVQKILKKFDKEGLYFAMFVQNGLFVKYIDTLFERGYTLENVKRQVTNLIEDPSTVVSFINHEDKVENKSREIISKIDNNSPEIFIVSSAKSAMSTCEKIFDKIQNRIDNYSSSIHLSEFKRIYFFTKNTI